MEGGYALFPGQRFSPMEDELLMYYLMPKVNGREVPGKEALICEVDLYGKEEPWSIWNRFKAAKANDLRKHKDLYFFTKLKKVSAKGSRKYRRVGGGTWKGQDAKNYIYLLDQNQPKTRTLLGSKKTYTYKNKDSVHHGGWIMYEYTLDKSQFLHKKQVDQNPYVLCLLRKNDISPEKKGKRQQEDEEEEDEAPENYVEDDEGDNIEPKAAIEEPQEKRQRLFPCPSNVPALPAAPSLEGTELEQWVNDMVVEAPLESNKPGEVDLYGANLSDVMDGGAYVGTVSFMEGLNQLTKYEQQPSTMAGAGEWKDESYLDFGSYLAY